MIRMIVILELVLLLSWFSKTHEKQRVTKYLLWPRGLWRDSQQEGTLQGSLSANESQWE